MAKIRPFLGPKIWSLGRGRLRDLEKCASLGPKNRPSEIRTRDLSRVNRERHYPLDHGPCPRVCAREPGAHWLICSKNDAIPKETGPTMAVSIPLVMRLGRPPTLIKTSPALCTVVPLHCGQE